MNATSAPAEDLIVIGKIVSVHGVRGDVKIYSFTDPIDNLLEYRRWTLRRGDEVKQVELVKGRLQGKILGMLPNPMLTADQVEMLKTDNVVSEAAKAEGRTVAAFGITPRSADAILPSYLWRYRPAGQFTRKGAA